MLTLSTFPVFPYIFEALIFNRWYYCTIFWRTAISSSISGHV